MGFLQCVKMSNFKIGSFFLHSFGCTKYTVFTENLFCDFSFTYTVREKRKQASSEPRKSGNDIDVLSTHPELHSKLDHIF